MKRTWSCLVCILAAALLSTTLPIPGFALSDGAYTVGRKTSYVNPETGSTVDGGTNIALGQSMCESIVEDHLLVEQVQGRFYMTVGIGLMSNIEQVRIQVRGENGVYQDVDITQTGSCQRNGDTCAHYRFQVPSLECTISPILYVTPMGRNVQFFFIPDISSAQEGKGNFISEMVMASAPEATTAPSASVEETKQPQVTDAPKASLPADDATQLPAATSAPEEGENPNLMGIWGVGSILVVVVAGVVISYLRKNEKD